MKKTFLTYLILLLSLASMAQIYKTEKQLSPGTTNEHFLYFAKSVKGKFYYLDHKNIYKYEKGILSKYPDCPLTGKDTVVVNDLTEYNGKIYISSTGFYMGSDTVGTCYFDGSSWKPVKSTKNNFVYSLCGSPKYLYLTDIYGLISKIDTVGNRTHIAKRKQWYYPPIHNYNFTDVLWMDTMHIYRYDGSKLDSLRIKFKVPVRPLSLFSSGDSVVYFIYDKDIYKVGKNLKLTRLDTVISSNNYQIVGELDSNLYINEYNTKETLKAFNLYTKKYSTVYYIYNQSIVGTYDKIYSYSYDFSPKGRTKIYELVDGVLVSGRVYEDLNNNCSFDKGEIPHKKLMLSFSNGTKNRLTFANDTGYYETTIVPGVNKINVERNHYLTKYDSCGGNKTFSLGNTYVVNVPYVIPGNLKDIGASITANLGFAARRGFSENYQIVYENFASSTEDLSIELEYPDSVTYKSSSLKPTSHSSNKLSFEIKNLAKNGSGQFNLIFEIHAKKKLNSKINFICNTYSKNKDLDTTNNTDTLTQYVRAAIDPNIKQSSPEGQVEKPVSKIKYHIQFQNEGNYKATRVVVVDTMDVMLPLSKVQMLSTKHPYTLRVEGNNVLIWEFDNINLVPKSEDDEESRGFISFEAPLSTPLTIGKSVKNRAHIYFDYEDPLPTPFAIVQVVDKTISIHNITNNQQRITIFPNPMQTILNIKGERVLGNILIINALGETVYENEVEEKEQIIDSENWAPGIYFLRLNKSGVVSKLVKY